MTKVLVVEDQPNIMQIVRYHFESAGFEGAYATSAEDAWRLLVAEIPDAMVTDITLPGEDGWGLIKRVRADGRFHQLPIVILTGTMDDQGPSRAKELGCDYLTKPFAASALLNKVKAGLEESSEFRRRPTDTPGPSGQIKMVPVAVVMLMDHFQVEGTIYLPPELGRFSDAWESVVRDQRSYFPVTNARITKGEQTIHAPFLEVRKSEVRAVFPHDVATEDDLPPPPPGH
jgi:CheY-like chemotaxis protein